MVQKEYSAGGTLVRHTPDGPEYLLIQIRKHGYELPKGHIEAGESVKDAARREIMEETGYTQPLKRLRSLGTLEYSFERGEETIHKHVTYFLFEATTSLPTSPDIVPKRTRAVRWFSTQDLCKQLFVSQALRTLLCSALTEPHLCY